MVITLLLLLSGHFAFAFAHIASAFANIDFASALLLLRISLLRSRILLLICATNTNVTNDSRF